MAQACKLASRRHTSVLDQLGLYIETSLKKIKKEDWGNPQSWECLCKHGHVCPVPRNHLGKSSPVRWYMLVTAVPGVESGGPLGLAG